MLRMLFWYIERDLIVIAIWHKLPVLSSQAAQPWAVSPYLLERGSWLWIPLAVPQILPEVRS